MRRTRKHTKVLALGVICLLTLATFTHYTSLATQTEPTTIPGLKTAGPSLDLASQVPAAIKRKNFLTIATSNVAPLASFDNNGQAHGYGVDVLCAIANTLGLNALFQPAEQDQSGTGPASHASYDLLLPYTSTTPTPRLPTAERVPFVNIHTTWATLNGNPTQLNPHNPCGARIGIQKGSEAGDFPDVGRECPDDNKPHIIAIDLWNTFSLTSQLREGALTAVIADSPKINALVNASDGLVEPLMQLPPHRQYIRPTHSQEVLSELVRQALAYLQREGTYERILKQWNIIEGNLTSFDE